MDSGHIGFHCPPVSFFAFILKEKKSTCAMVNNNKKASFIPHSCVILHLVRQNCTWSFPGDCAMQISLLQGLSTCSISLFPQRGHLPFFFLTHCTKNSNGTFPFLSERIACVFHVESCIPVCRSPRKKWLNASREQDHVPE